MKSLRRMFSYMRPYKKETILALILLTGMVVADLMIPRLTQRVIDVGIANKDMRVVITTSLFMVVVALVSAAFSIGNTIFSVKVAQSLAADVRNDLVDKVQTFSFGNLDKINTGQLITRTTSDINQIQMIFLLALRMLTRAPLWVIGASTMLILTSPRLSLKLVILIPLFLVVIWFFVKNAQPLFMTVQRKLDRLNQVMQENLAGIRVVKAFVREEHEKERFATANINLTNQTIKVYRMLAFLLPSITLILNLGIVLVIWFGGLDVIYGTLSVGKIVAFTNYLFFALFPLIMLAAMTGPVASADASAGRVYEILDSEPNVKEAKIPAKLPVIKGKVAFEHVFFNYNGGSEEAVLKDISFVANPGETVAILGATGSGKSSLINLIPRFYDVTSGQITLDGVDIRELRLNFLRSQIGFVLQEAILFTGTIRENITFGRHDATEEEIIQAAKTAQAHDFIMRLPEGYESVIGEKGTNLSGGQKQRISIARALLVNPHILVLDDSTSAVDFETEAKLQASLEALLASKERNASTTFVVAQRISTVFTADKIIVLDKGSIAAVGTHHELMKTSRIYQEIYESQLGNPEKALLDCSNIEVSMGLKGEHNGR